MGLRIVGVIAFVCFYNTAISQRIYSREEYIQMYREVAISEMYKTGVPASITLAQGCLESGNGNSTLSRRSNNHFGIKCGSAWTGKRVYYTDDAPNECFRAYNSAKESYLDHSKFLTSNSRYASLFKLQTTDYKGWSHGLKKAGYATSPSYGHDLIKIIEDNKLYVYDKVINIKQIDKYEQLRIADKNGSGRISSYSNRTIQRRNGLRTITVKANESMQSIANDLGIPVRDLYKYNDYPIRRRIHENEILYIEKKARKTAKGVKSHIIEKGEDLHYLSQMYGIRLNILCRRNGISKNEKLSPGTVIFLRTSPR
jgi:Muramidase (flagellum-specific)